MNRMELAEHISKLEKNKIFLDYNIIERGSNGIIADCRCQSFAIYHKVDNCGIVIEYVKGKIFVSVFGDCNFNECITLDSVKTKLPIRFKEILAEIKKHPKTQPIPTSMLRKILELTTTGVPKNKYNFINHSDSRNSILLLNIEDLINNSKVHTYIYQDLTFFGKNNRHFRASIKRDIPTIRQIIDMEK